MVEIKQLSLYCQSVTLLRVQSWLEILRTFKQGRRWDREIVIRTTLCANLKKKKTGRLYPV